MGTSKPLSGAVVFFAAILATGCASGPTSGLTSAIPSNSIASVAGLGKQAKPLSAGLLDFVQNQLKSGAAETSSGAARLLGLFAKNDNRGSFNPIDILTQTIQSNQEASVRGAAANALAGVHESASKHLDGLFPSSGFGSNENPNVGAPQMSFLGGLFR